MAACLIRCECREVIIVRPAGEIRPMDAFEPATRKLQRFFGRCRARDGAEDRVDKEPHATSCVHDAPLPLLFGAIRLLICRLRRLDGSNWVGWSVTNGVILLVRKSVDCINVSFDSLYHPHRVPLIAPRHSFKVVRRHHSTRRWTIT